MLHPYNGCLPDSVGHFLFFKTCPFFHEYLYLLTDRMIVLLYGDSRSYCGNAFGPLDRCRILVED